MKNSDKSVSITPFGDGLFSVLAVLMLTGALVRPLSWLEVQLETGWLVPVSWMLLFAVAGTGVISKMLQSGAYWFKHQLGLGSLFIVFSLIWALLSCIWSVAIITTLKMWVVLAGTTLIGFYWKAFLNDKRIINPLTIGFICIALSSIALHAFEPELSIHTEQWHLNRWKGVLSHKNHLGNVAAVAFVLSVTSMIWSKNPLGWVFAVVSASLSAAMLVLAESATGVVVALSGLITVGICLLRSVTRLHPASYVFTGAIVLLTFYIFRDQALDLLGRSSNFTGRLGIWSKLWIEIQQRPWVGFGYEAFWANRGAHTTQLNEYLSGTHNGYLKIWIEQGAIGLALIILAYAYAIYRFLQAFWFGKFTPGTVASGALLIMVLVNNLGENTLTQAGSLFHALWVYAVLRLDRSESETNQAIAIPEHTR